VRWSSGDSGGEQVDARVYEREIFELLAE